jgi:hypothetical protein
MTRLAFFTALAVAAAVILGCGPAKELPDEIPKALEPTEKPVVVPAASDPAAKAYVEKVVNAYTGNKPDLVNKGKAFRLAMKGKVLPVGDNQQTPVNATRKISGVWPDRMHDVMELHTTGGRINLEVWLRRPHMWIGGANPDDLVPAQREKNFAADETGQYWMALLLPLTDPKAIVFDLQSKASVNAENQPYTIQTLKLSLGEFPPFYLAFDPNSHALVGVEYKVMELGQPILRSWFMDEHKPGPDGLNLPTRTRLRWNNDTKEEWEVEKWEFPDKIGDEEFAPPTAKKG